MLEQPHFKHKDGNSTFIGPEDWPQVDAVVDWLIEKNRSGYKMVNSVRRLEEMKAFMRGKLQDWNCRAGQNSLIIRTDGTLAPCFPMYNVSHDWGVAGQPCFDRRQLLDMKVNCQPHCFSTLNHNLAYCYDASRAIRWVLKQAVRGFHGTTGSAQGSMHDFDALSQLARAGGIGTHVGTCRGCRSRFGWDFRNCLILM